MEKISMYLPDVNVWLALVFDAHYHHSRAVKWFSSVSDGTCSFCRVTQAGFLRLATNPAVFGAEALTLAKAWDAYDAMKSDARIVFSHEPEGIELEWRRFTHKHGYSHKIWNDAYLAAFALSLGMTVVTFDKGFSAYKGVKSKMLG